jgi:hypothetical protein
MSILPHRLAMQAFAALCLAQAAPALADGLPNEPLPRFEDAVCPGVIGLSLATAEEVVERIRTNAAGFGLDLADPEDCEPNIIVAFLADGREYLQRLSDERSYLFADLMPGERRRLLAESGPARAWLRTVVRTRDGIAVGRSEDLVQPPQAGMWSAHSRIYRPVRVDIDTAMVLIDRAATEGLSSGQLADYATMRALASDYPTDAASRGSILTLFDEGGPTPAGLSPYDRAFLEGLYEGMPNLPASARLRDLPEEEQTLAE